MSEQNQEPKFVRDPAVTHWQHTSSAGTLRIGSKRSQGGQATPALAHETIIDVDRTHPVLGNPFVLRNHLDHEERERVINAYEKLFEKDRARSGPMTAAAKEIASQVERGAHITLRCWCAPRRCHAEVLARFVAAEIGLEEVLQAKISSQGSLF